MRKYSGVDLRDALLALRYRKCVICVFGFMIRMEELATFSLLTHNFGPPHGLPDGLPHVEFTIDVGITVRPTDNKYYSVGSGTASLNPKT
jgi:hypothetical protein